MKRLVVVSHPRGWPFALEGVDVVLARDYLTDPRFSAEGPFRVFNLCREYRYQSKGYYVSLVAEARGHRVIPRVKTIQDLKATEVARILADDVDAVIERALASHPGPESTIDVIFGQTVDPQLRSLGRHLYQLFQAPILRARFHRNDTWSLRGLKALSIAELDEAVLPFAEEAARRYLARRDATPTRRDARGRLDLAILVNPGEQDAPSDERALVRFERAADRAGFVPERIGRDEYGRLAEYDGLLIRETTSVHHHTYRFARRAESEGIPVIDDPDSILRCANKVFLAELMRSAQVPIPTTLVVHSDNVDQVGATLGFPCVLKRPDSSFSRGVVRAANPEELGAHLTKLLNDSDLVIAQAYTPTPFDWRIGVLEGKPLYACKYFMARGHWQILNWEGRKREEVEGRWETLDLADVPRPVLDLALRAALAIGTGLYGIDIKEVDGRVLLIEVNDNPSIEAGVEDEVAGEALYDAIVGALRARVEARYHRGVPG